MIKHLISLKIRNMMDIKGFYFNGFKTFMIKKTYGSGIKKDNISNKVHKPVVRKFKKRKVYSPFIDNICHADLDDMELISKCTKGIRFLLCFIGIICYG